MCSFPWFIHIDRMCCAVLCLVTQSCPNLCDPMDCSPPGSSVHVDSPGKNTGVGCHALLPGIFPTQGLNPGLLYCRRFFTVWATMEVYSTILGKYVLFVDLSTLTDNLELNSWLYDGLYEASKRGQKKNQSPKSYSLETIHILLTLNKGQ